MKYAIDVVGPIGDPDKTCNVVAVTPVATAALADTSETWPI